MDEIFDGGDYFAYNFNDHLGSIQSGKLSNHY
jgi:hypothetical protein